MTFDGGDVRIDQRLAWAIIALIVTAFILGALIVKRVYMQTPMIRSALERELVVYQERLQSRPNDLDARVAIAQVYLRMGNASAAEEELKKVLDIDPKHWDALFQLGQVYLSDKKKDQAIVQFKKAAKAKPTDELAYYQLGSLAYKDKNYKQSVVYMEKAVAISPILADAHFFLGSSYEHLGEKDKAAQHYQDALKFIPDYAEAKNGLARVRP